MWACERWRECVYKSWYTQEFDWLATHRKKRNKNNNLRNKNTSIQDVEACQFYICVCRSIVFFVAECWVCVSGMFKTGARAHTYCAREPLYQCACMCLRAYMSKANQIMFYFFVLLTDINVTVSVYVIAVKCVCVPGRFNAKPKHTYCYARLNHYHLCDANKNIWFRQNDDDDDMISFVFYLETARLKEKTLASQLCCATEISAIKIKFVKIETFRICKRHTEQ